MKEIECPYCGSYNEEPDDYYECGQDDNIEMECDECGKYFYTSYYMCASWNDSIKAPCLNGEACEFTYPISTFGLNPKYYLECECGERQEITEEEYIKRFNPKPKNTQDDLPI